ncbi:hypothetical protein BC833DRAFT_167978 [Globomyces pollinis-pini]|nr:hypothetical protein BC833DRAFT_167978 [Globomyces pollinis-pini]
MEDEKQNSRDSLDNQQNGDPMFELADDYENEDEEGDSDGYQDFLKPNKKITDSVMSILDSELIQNLKEEDKINSNASIKKAVTEYFDSTSNEQPQSTISIEIEPQTITTPNEKLSIKENDTSTTTQPKVMEPPEVTIINSTSLVQISEPLINPDVTMLDANKLHSIMKSQPNSPLPRRVSTNRSISFSVDEQQQKNGSNRKNNISKEEPVFGNASEPPIRRVQSEKKAKLAEKFSQSPESSIVISIQDFGNETIATQPFSSDYSFEFSSPTVSVTKPTSTTSTDEAFSTIGQYEHSMESNGEELDTLFVEGRKSTKLTFIKEAVSESKELLGNSTEILRHSITKIPTLDFREGMLLQAIKEYHATDLDELSLEIGTLVELDVTPQNEGEYWLKGTAANGQSGFFPRQCVTEYNEKNANEIKEKEVEKNFSPNENDSIMEEEAVKPVPKGTTVTAIYAYEPTKKDELALAKGSTILVLECPDGGWWKGVTGIEDKRPVTGWFPASLVKIKENAPEKAKAKEEVFKSDNDEKMNSLDVGSENGRKVSWFRRLRSPTETNPDFTESERRKRSLSAPAKRLPLLNVSGSELPNIFGGSDLSRDELDRSLSGFEIKPIVTDGEFSTSSARASVSLPRGTTIDINSLPSTNIQGRGTIYLSGAGNNGEIFPGATDEKIQDKVSPAIYKFLPDSEKQRLSVVWELIQTERDYVRDLSIIIEIFMKPISSLPSIIPKNIQTLFGNIEQILTVKVVDLNT